MISSTFDRVARLNPRQRAIFEQRLVELRRPNLAARQAIARAKSNCDYPLTHAQRRVWAYEQLFPGACTYNVSWVTSYSGCLDGKAFEKAIQTLFRRHSILGATFHQTPAGPVQRISALSGVSIDRYSSSSPEIARQIVQERVVRPFDLENGPLLRLGLISLDEQEQWLVWVIHHLVTDGVSMTVLDQEFAALYSAFAAGLDPELPELEIEYRDFAADNAPSEQALAYWLKELAGAPPVLDLPLDYVRNPASPPDAWTADVPVSSALLEALERRAQEKEVTLYAILVSAWAALLHRYGGGDEIVVGSPFAARSRREHAGIVGFFANTLPIRVDFSGDALFNEVLRRVHTKVAAALDHQDVAFDTVVEQLRTPRAPGVTPVFQTAVAYLNSPPGAAINPVGLRARHVQFLHPAAQFDAMLNVNQIAGEFEASISLRASLFDACASERMSGHLLCLLEGIARGGTLPVSRYELVTEAQQKRLLELGSRSSRPYPNQSVHTIFEEQAARTPNCVALVDQHRTVTYAELSGESDAITSTLQQAGVAAGAIVAVLCDRSAAMVAAFLGVLKAGAAYLPIDASDPPERTQSLLREAGVQWILTPGSGDVARITDHVTMPGDRGQDTAYVMFTSGSTGLPKAVAIPHRGIVRLVKNNTYARLDADGVFLHMAPPAFDASTFEIWAPLLNGGRCVIHASPKPSLAEIGEAIQKHGVTTLWLTSSLFNAAIDEAPEILAPLDQLLTGGEALSVRHVAKAMAVLPRTQIINGYGPTESTTFACCYPIPRDFDFTRRSIPIGPPIANTVVYILDSRQQPVAVGVPGEIYLGGDGLASGYHNRPELTAAAFVPDPFRPGEDRKLYRTGDRGRWLATGEVDFLGRVDDQVKIRGFRVEPGEVEAALNAIPGVAQAAVKAHSDSSGVKFLVGYLVPEDGRTVDVAELTQALAASLPSHMVPQRLVILDRLPLRANGKIDRSALPSPDAATGPISAAQPKDDLERTLLSIWRELLNEPNAGVSDDFFALGGHSLLAVRLVARIEQQLGQSLPVAAILAAPTVEKLANLLRTSADPGVSRIKGGGSKAPIFWVDPVVPLGRLASELPDDRPFYSVSLNGKEVASSAVPWSLKDIAVQLAAKIERENSGRPLILGSFCIRALLAVEIARLLRVRGVPVPLVIMVDASDPATVSELAAPVAAKALKTRTRLHLTRLRKLAPGEVGPYVAIRARSLIWRFRSHLGQWVPKWRNRELDDPIIAAAAQHDLAPFEGRVFLGRCVKPENLSKDYIVKSWTALALGPLRVRSIPGDHSAMFYDPHVAGLAQVLQEEIAAAEASDAAT